MNTKFSYLAGYIDGDGCFYVGTYIQKPKNILAYEYSIQICSTCKEVIEYFFKEFNGKIREKSEKRGNRKDSFQWVIKNNPSLNVCKMVYPFLITKKNTCGFYQELGNSIVPNRGEKISEIALFKRKEIINQIKEEIHMKDLVDRNNFSTLKSIKKTMEPTEEDFAYFSGLIDSEGCFRIKSWQSKRQGRNRDYVISLEIGNTKFSIFPWILQRFGGSVLYRNPATSRCNPWIMWSLSSKALNKILYKIYPFLIVKKERCKKVMEFYETILHNGGDRHSSKFKENCVEVRSKRERIAKEIQSLNAKGKH